MSYHEYTVARREFKSNSPNGRSDAAREADLRLARAVADGSIEAWHAFIERYSGLIFGVIRRRLVMEEEDEIRTVYVDVLKALYDGALTRYRGEARLSTWLTVFTGGRALDAFRHRHGRSSAPGKLAEMSPFDREVFRLFYIDRLPLDVIAQVLRAKRFSVTAEGIVESVRRLDESIDRRVIERLGYERHARRRGVDSGRMLEYLIGLEHDLAGRSEHDRPDAYLAAQESRAVAERVRKHLSRLPPDERQIVHYRFERGWTAARIAETLGLDGRRRVYTLIDRIVRKLRGYLERGEE